MLLFWDNRLPYRSFNTAQGSQWSPPAFSSNWLCFYCWNFLSSFSTPRNSVFNVLREGEKKTLTRKKTGNFWCVFSSVSLSMRFGKRKSKSSQCVVDEFDMHRYRMRPFAFIVMRGLFIDVLNYCISLQEKVWKAPMMHRMVGGQGGLYLWSLPTSL